MLEAFAACNDLAPLHNPANLKGVDAITAILPNVPQIGVFDTAFHQTMPEYAYLYAIPYELYKSTVYVVMVSTELPIVTFHSACANIWGLNRKD